MEKRVSARGFHAYDGWKGIASVQRVALRLCLAW